MNYPHKPFHHRNGEKYSYAYDAPLASTNWRPVLRIYQQEQQQRVHKFTYNNSLTFSIAIFLSTTKFWHQT